MTTVALSGSREWENEATVEQAMLRMRDSFAPRFLVGFDPIELTPDGLDRIAAGIAVQYGMPHQFFPADWNKYGKQAGPLRNAQMAKEADHVVAFWDGKSPGTANMIWHGLSNGTLAKVYLIDGRQIEDDFSYLFQNDRIKKAQLPPMDPLTLDRERVRQYLETWQSEPVSVHLNQFDLHVWYLSEMSGGELTPQLEAQYANL